MNRLLITCGLVLTAGCSSIQAVPLEFIAQEKPSTIELYTGYGRHVAVDNPQIVGDSIVGTEGSKPVSVPLERVEQISARRFSSPRTVMLVGSLGILAALGAYIVLNDDGGEAEDLCSGGALLDVGEREACGFSMRTR